MKCCKECSWALKDNDEIEINNLKVPSNFSFTFNQMGLDPIICGFPETIKEIDVKKGTCSEFKPINKKG